MWSLLRLWRRHPVRLSLGIVLAILALLASIGLLTLSGWFLAASAVAGSAGLYSFNYMLPAAGVRGAAIIRTAARYAERLVSHDATFRVLQHLRVFTFSRLMALAPFQLARFRHGDLLSRFVADVDTLDHLYLRVIAPLAGALVVIVSVSIGLSLIDVPLALTLGGIMLLTLLLLPALFWRQARPLGYTIGSARNLWHQGLIQWLEGQAELMIYGASATWRKEIDQQEQRWQQAQLQQQRLQAKSQALLLLISGCTATLLLWLAAAQADKGPIMALMLFCALAAFEALGPVTAAFLPLAQVISAAQRVSQITQQSAAMVYPSTPLPQHAGMTVELNHLHFTWPQRLEPVLNDLCLTINAGEHVALLGPTGCGKSTILALLTRQAEAACGDILLNQQPITRWDETSLRQRISVMPQRIYLFSRTLRENLLVARPDASDERLLQVLEQVGLRYLAEEDEQLDMWMGDGGRPLSGGELRRIGIARALLHDGDLWLLDEPTEGLDSHTERQILDLIFSVTQDKTLLMVTHRLTQLHQLDRICVMEAGQLSEQGTHDQLIASQGDYWRLHRRFAL